VDRKDSAYDRSTTVVAERELKRVQKKLEWADDELQVNQVESIGPGNIISLRISDEHINEVIEVVGAKNVSAERVAGRAIASMKRFLNSGAAVGEYLCDQLLLPLALGNGGRFTTIEPSLHTRTNIDVVTMFLDCEIHLNILKDDKYEVSVSKQLC